MNNEVLALVTAWINDPGALVCAALPESGTQPHLAALANSAHEHGLPELAHMLDSSAQEIGHLRDLVEGSTLFAATALICWSNAMGVDPADLIKMIALSQQEAETLADPS